MGELKIYLTDEAEARFRKAAMAAFGYGRGSLSEAAAEALLNWCKEKEAVETKKEQSAVTPVNDKRELPSPPLTTDTTVDSSEPKSVPTA